MTNYYASYPISSGGTSIARYANFAAFPLASSVTNGTLAIALDTDTLYISTGAVWDPIASPGAALSVGTFDSGVASANGAHIDTNQLIMQSASTTVPGLVNTTTQHFTGSKTFAGNVGINNASPPNPLSVVGSGGGTVAFGSLAEAPGYGAIAFNPGGAITNANVTFSGTTGQTVITASGGGIIEIRPTQTTPGISVNTGGLVLINEFTAGVAAAQLDMKVGSASRVGLAINLAAAQSVDAFEVINSSSTTVAAITNVGGGYFAGNVGVGTTTPGSRLEVKGTGTTSATSSLNITNSASSSLLMVQDTGNVGVGTTSGPSYKLDVRDGTAASGSAAIVINNSMAFGGVPSVSASFISQNMYYDGTNDLRINTGVAAARMLIRDDGGGGGTQNAGRFNFQTVAAGANPISWTSLLIIDYSNQVGIGTVSPGSKLEVKGAGSTSATSALNVTNSSGTSLLFAQNDGNIGIGTITPGSLLTVGSSAQFKVAASGAVTSDGDITLGSGGAGTFSIGGITGTRTIINANGIKNFASTETSPRLNFDRDLTGSGQAGFSFLTSGTATAAAQGVAVSIVAAQTLGLFTSNGTALTERLRIDGSGQVGIGTTSPGAALEVAGQVKITGGTPGTGKVLTSDSVGLASWATGLTNPMTTTGDIIVGGAAGAPARLAIGASSTVLKGGSTPGWGQVTSSQVDSTVAVTNANQTLSGIQSYSGQPSVMAYITTTTGSLSANLSITSGSSLGWTEEVDNANNYSGGVFTVPSGGAGNYLISINLQVSAVGGTLTRLQASIQKNATSHYVVFADQSPLTVTSGGLWQAGGSTILPLSVGDTIQIESAAGGTSYTINGGAPGRATWIAITKVT